jgi:hypothetical protein
MLPWITLQSEISTKKRRMSKYHLRRLTRARSLRSTVSSTMRPSVRRRRWNGSGEEPDSPQSNPTTLNTEETHLSTTEQEFVEAYCESDAPAESELIEENIERNLYKLGGIARTDILVEAIQERVGTE